MDETHYNENESNWQIPNDEYEGGNEEETLASPSEYQKFFDCNSDKCEKQRKPRQHKIKTNMETLIRNMDNPNNFRETLSEITTITHNILNSLKLCIDNRNSKSTENERSKYSCGYNSATYHSGEKHLQRITTLADKFLKTFDEPCKESMDQIFLTCKPYNESKRNNCEKYQNGDSSELKDFPLVIPFKPFELIVPVKIGKGSVIKTFQHQQDWTESSIEDAHTFIPNLMYHKVSESSSDIFFSLKDTSYFSCEDSEPLIERFPIWGTFSHKEFCTNATQTQCPFLPKLADATKSKSTGFLRTPESVSLCLICSKPINCCICVKPSFTKIHIGNIDRANHAPSELLDETYQTRPITLSKKIQTMMPDVNVDFQVTYGAAPSYISTCKKCGKAECVCDSSAAVASTTLIHPAKSILCSKCGIENCTCNTAQISSQKCNKCLKPIEKCICEKPQTSKTYKSNLPEVHTNYCQRCAKALDRCICEKPQPSKYIESSNIMVGSSLHSCTCDKPLGEKCTICGNDLNKCICTEAHGSEAVTSQSKLPSKSSSKKLKTVTVPTVCQCGLRQEKCKCTKSSPTDVCGKCGLAIKKCICPEKLPRIYCLKCQRTIDKCICKTISQATDTPRTCETCGNFIEKCVCSKLKPLEATLCNRCGELLHKCVCKKTQAIQTEVFEGICSKCGEPFFKCACRTDEGVQTINEEICERCGNEVSVCSCSRTEATQTDPPKYKRILCDKWQYKVYVKEDEEPIPCTCDMEHVHSEEKLTDLLKIPESDLEDDIVKCICDLKEAADLPVFVEKMIQEEAVFVEETLESEEEVVEEELPEEEVIEKTPLIAPEPPPKPPRKVYRLAFPQHKDLEICKKCRFEPSPLIDQDGRVFCPGNCGCCLCPWKPHLSPSQEDVLKHRKFKVCKCRKRGTVFTKFAATDSDCSQVSYFDECPCRDLAEAKHFQLYGFDMWDLNEKLLQKFRGEQVYLRDVREITPTKIPSTKFLSSKLYIEEFKDAQSTDTDNKDN